MKKLTLNTQISALSLILVVVGIFAGYEFYTLNLAKMEIAMLEAESRSFEEALLISEEENQKLEQEVRDRQYIIESFEGQISDITGVVGDLKKLQDTDPELLRKYSKVYFLNENYVPSRLTEITKEFTFSTSAKNDFLIHADVWPHLERLLKTARQEGIELLVTSTFRSFGTQGALKSSYVVTYGAGTANQFSAEQGFSEHQLGTTVDFTTSTVGGTFLKFESDSAYKWLQDNAHKYGFVLSYPKNNTYYAFEPWHWRFVGVELASMLKRSDKYFYDLDQREIDEYLIKLFD